MVQCGARLTACRLGAGSTGSKGCAVADKFTSIDDYISTLPDDVAAILEKVRHAIHKAVPLSGT